MTAMRPGSTSSRATRASTTGVRTALHCAWSAEEEAGKSGVLVGDRDALALRELHDLVPAGALAAPEVELGVGLLAVVDGVESGREVRGGAAGVSEGADAPASRGGIAHRGLGLLAGGRPLANPGVGVLVMDALGGNEHLPHVRRAVIGRAEGDLEAKLEVCVVELTAIR